VLQKPDLEDEKLVACVGDEYGLDVARVTFLPLGADLNTAVYRAVTAAETPYFMKLRSGRFDETSVALPRFLAEQGIGHIIAPLTTHSGRLWAGLEGFKVILYPFVEGRDGYQVSLPDRQWPEFGAAMRRIHAVVLPPSLAGRIRREGYPAEGREMVRASLRRATEERFDDPIAAELAAALKARQQEILDFVERAERLARELLARPPEFTLCHSDIHAGNILITAAGTFFIVDWDEPILAPKERDLMSIGAGLMGGWRMPEEEQALFYQGYGNTPIDPVPLAYYRYERIVQDIAVECDHIFSMRGARQDRQQSLEWFLSNFRPGNVIDLAYRSDKTHSHDA
jgi:spectinomycin phosphotransferase